MAEVTATEQLVKSDRVIVVAGLVAIALLAWAYVLAGAGTGTSTVAMTTWSFPPAAHMANMPATWDLSYWAIMLVMWWVMMVAMMVPSAAPMILLFARVNRHAQKKGQMDPSPVPTAAFAGGYLVAWLAFSVVATTLQWGIEKLGLLHAMMMWSTSAGLTAAFLVAAGVYQLSPLKHVCLDHCRSPALFLSKHWRKGRWGALRMGVDHGLFCVGCCWFLMALLFVGGIMNLVWIAGLAIFVLIEKVAPHGQWFARASGAGFILAGVYVLVAQALV